MEFSSRYWCKATKTCQKMPIFDKLVFLSKINQKSHLSLQC